MAVATFKGTGHRVMGRGIFEPTYHGGFRRHPFPSHLAAGKLAALKEMVDRVAGYGEKGRRQADVENFGNLGGNGALWLTFSASWRSARWLHPLGCCWPARYSGCRVSCPEVPIMPNYLLIFRNVHIISRNIHKAIGTTARRDTARPASGLIRCGALAENPIGGGGTTRACGHACRLCGK